VTSTATVVRPATSVVIVPQGCALDGVGPGSAPEGERDPAHHDPSGVEHLALELHERACALVVGELDVELAHDGVGIEVGMRIADPDVTQVSIDLATMRPVSSKTPR
jgi:hypothetical protein